MKSETLIRVEGLCYVSATLQTFTDNKNGAGFFNVNAKSYSINLNRYEMQRYNNGGYNINNIDLSQLIGYLHPHLFIIYFYSYFRFSIK